MYGDLPEKLKKQQNNQSGYLPEINIVKKKVKLDSVTTQSSRN